MWDHMNEWGMSMMGGWMPLWFLIVLLAGIAIGVVIARR